jgi:hypothetical protein
MADIVYGAARSGTVATAATGSSTSFAVHNLTGQLLSGSATDAENLATLCYIGGASPEYFAYQSASLTGPGAYTLAGLERQAYGTPAGAHAVGDVFVRVDDSVAQYEDLDVSMIGMVIYVKVCSFNIYGQAQQGLADVSATTYTVTGNMAQYLLGIGGKGITVDATALAVNVSGTPSPASITLTAHHKGLLQGSVVWTIVGGSIAAGGATSPTPDTCVVDTSAILSYPLTVRASITDAVATYLDDTTIVSVVDGDSAFLLIGDANMRVAGNTASKVATSSAWDSQAYSADAYIGGAAMSMTPLLVCNVFAGLNADPLADADFPSIDYGIYAENTGKVFLFTSGTNLGQFGTWGVGDILGVAYDNASVKFTKNGSPLHTVVAAAGLKLYLDSTFHDAGAAARFTFVPAGAVGGAGADAPLLTLSLTQQTFTYDGSDAATPSSQTITASAILQNVTGVAAFTCTLYDAAGSSLGTVAMGGSGNTRTLTNAQFAAAQWAVIVASLGGLSDTETIVRLRDGQNSIVADLTNQAQTLPADVLGHVSDYTGASTQMTVYRGLVDDSANWTFSRSNSSGVTSSLSGNTLTVTALADINDTGYVDITAARTGFVSITKRFTLSKSKGALVSSGLASLGNFAVSGYTVLQTHACTVQFKFSSTGFIAKREGQAETSSLTESSTKWSQSTPPSVGYKIQVGPAVGGSPHNTTGSGTLSGLGSMLTLDSTHSVTVGLVITNGICDAYVPYTIYDSTGTTQLASGNISLEAESTN